MSYPTPSDEVERKVVDSLNRKELHVIHVGAYETTPSFSYTIGLNQLHGHPELMVTELPVNNAHNILHSAFDRVAEGERFTHLDRAFRVVSLALPACFLRLTPEVRDQLLTLASWVNNRDEFDALQCVWPDAAGLFPWDTGFDNNFHQTVLAEMR